SAASLHSLRQPAFYLAALLNPFLVHDGVIHDRALMRGKDKVNPSVTGLDSHWVGVIVRAFSDIAAPGPGSVLIWRKRNRQRRPLIHAIVVHEQQVAAPQFDEVHRRVRILKLRLGTLA